MMTAGGNAEGKRSERVEGEDVLRTVECLRGRLMAERTASSDAKEEADQLGSKLNELETRLKEETKSRNRAEKRLKALMKKLESLEIFYVSDESERSGFVERSEISSASSVASTSTKEAEDHKQANANPNVVAQSIQALTMENPPVTVRMHSSFVPAVDLNPKQVSQFWGSSSQTSAGEEMVNSCQKTAAQNFETAETSSPKTSSPGKCPRSPAANETSSSFTATEKSHDNSSPSGQIDQEQNIQSHSFVCTDKVENSIEMEQDDYVDNSLALVAVDLPKTEQRIDPVVLDATVKEVLDALRHAKEKLQTSMERRRMIRVG